MSSNISFTPGFIPLTDVNLTQETTPPNPLLIDKALKVTRDRVAIEQNNTDQPEQSASARVSISTIFKEAFPQEQLAPLQNPQPSEPILSEEQLKEFFSLIKKGDVDSLRLALQDTPTLIYGLDSLNRNNCLFYVKTIEMASFLLDQMGSRKTEFLNFRSPTFGRHLATYCFRDIGRDLGEYYVSQGAYFDPDQWLNGDEAYFEHPYTSKLIMVARWEREKDKEEILKKIFLQACHFGHLESFVFALHHAQLATLKLDDASLNEFYQEAIKGGFEKIIEQLSLISPLEKHQHLAGLACQMGYPEIAEMLHPGETRALEQLNFSLPDLPTEKSTLLNPAHAKLYGGISSQEIYQKEFRESTQYALYCLQQKDCNISQLFQNLAHRRLRIAALLLHKPMSHFGTERKTGLAITPFNQSYIAYKEKLAQKIGSNNFNIQVYGVIGNHQIPLTKINPMGWVHTDKKYLSEIMSHIERLCGHIHSTSFSDGESLREKIAELHWWLSHAMPFKRGSAAISEMLIKALWYLHGYLPPETQKGINMDCEALINANCDEFIKTYPLGKLIQKDLS